MHTVINFFRYFSVILCIGLMALVTLSSCTSSTVEGGSGSFSQTFNGHYKIGKPYKIKNTWYYPKKDDAYDKVGVASWYGPGFHGKKTANGHVYDQHSLTAAHNTLPLPSMVSVTNLDNGRSVLVMVSDRGPYAKDRIIDVSERAADLLQFKKNGTAKVRIRYLPQETKMLLASLGLEPIAGAKPTKQVNLAHTIEKISMRTAKNEDVMSKTVVTSHQPTLPSSKPSLASALKAGNTMFVQVGAFKNHLNASRVAKQLSSLGNVEVEKVHVKDEPLYRVRVGPVDKMSKAQNILDKVMNQGNSQAVIIRING